MEERKARVMLANDEAHIRELLNLTLTSLGAEVGRNRAQTPVPEIVWISLCHAAGTACVNLGEKPKGMRKQDDIRKLLSALEEIQINGILRTLIPLFRKNDGVLPMPLAGMVKASGNVELDSALFLIQDGYMGRVTAGEMVAGQRNRTYVKLSKALFQDEVVSQL